jgi:hypothetical protein
MGILAPILGIDSAKRNKLGPLLPTEGIALLYTSTAPLYGLGSSWLVTTWFFQTQPPVNSDQASIVKSTGIGSLVNANGCDDSCNSIANGMASPRANRPAQMAIYGEMASKRREEHAFLAPRLGAGGAQ